MESVLDLTAARKYVGVIDAREFLKLLADQNLTVYEVPYDCCACPDTVWLTPPLEPVDEGAVSPLGITYRTVEGYLVPRDEEVISMGSVYFPHVEQASYLFTWGFNNVFRKVNSATKVVPYTKEIMEFGGRIRQRITENWHQFYCAHIRVGDSYFHRQRDEHLELVRRTLVGLALNASPGVKIPLLLLSDTDGKDYEAIVEPLREKFEVFRLGDQWAEEVARVRLLLGFNVDIMHLEATTCAHADHFVGNKFSTFSKRVRALRSKALKLPAESVSLV